MKIFRPVLLAVVVAACAAITPPRLAAAPPGLTLDNHFYKRFEGMLGREKVVLHFQRLNDKVAGALSLPSEKRAIRLTGRCDSTGAFSFSAVPAFGSVDQAVGTATGSFTAPGRIEGQWERPKAKGRTRFALDELYGADAVPLDVFPLSQARALFDDRTEPKAEVNLVYLFPNRFADAAVLSKLRTELMPLAGAADPAGAVGKIAGDYFAEYLERRQEYSDDLAGSFNYASDYIQTVLLNEKKLLVLVYESYEYSGGAHPNQATGFFNYDLARGRKLGLADVFTADGIARLAPLIEKKVRAQEGIKPKTSLTDAGFFENRIAPAENFFLSTAGIGFFYNIYEVRPYALGPLAVFIPYAEIGSLVRKDSPVKRLMVK